MKVRPSVLTLGLVLAAVGPASAQDFLQGAYVGVRAIGSFAKIDSVDTNGFTGATNIQNDSDTVGGVAGVVGYRWEGIPLRTEIEGGYRFRFDFDAQDSGPPVVDYESNLSTITLLLNALLEWRNDTDFTPFIGGTIGWARNSSETTRVVIPGGPSVDKDTDKDNLAWGAMAGLDWHFADHWSAELAYRYLDLGEVDVGSFAGGDSVSADDYTSHDVMVSVNFRF